MESKRKKIKEGKMREEWSKSVRQRQHTYISTRPKRRIGIGRRRDIYSYEQI